MAGITREQYVEALKAERGHVEQSQTDEAAKAVRLADIDAELERHGAGPDVAEKPARRSRESA